MRGETGLVRIRAKKFTGRAESVSGAVGEVQSGRTTCGTPPVRWVSRGKLRIKTCIVHLLFPGERGEVQFKRL